MRERRGKPLMEDQLPIFKRCMALLDGGDEGWKVLKSPPHYCPDTKMWFKYFPHLPGERNIATGKAVGVVDCSAEEFAANMMDYCNNNDMRVSKEDGNPARLVLRNGKRVNESTVATIINVPLFIENREFIAQMICKSELNGSVTIAIESVDENVDYGASFRKTRGLTRGLWKMENLDDLNGVHQC
ncbi:hypothetical protein TrLO_g11582 [Triparma laevis f. longispina]|uniref:Uncharacterized protein n=1 Tax=Triparma laevis f. longispina TaxID=1714387 RepID=A0A9W7F958_9STRA|nr:hypothetical protein TrLO_g11582 [Triparma laevis f. longispina]